MSARVAQVHRGSIAGFSCDNLQRERKKAKTPTSARRVRPGHHKQEHAMRIWYQSYVDAEHCNAVQAEREGYDAFVVGHFQDAGLYEARSVVDIPVLGLGESSMLHACQLGQRSGIVTINPRYISWFHHQISKYGLGERVTGVHAMRFQPGQIMQAFGSDERLSIVKNVFEEQAKPLVDAGVDVLIPGGGIPMLLFSQLHQHNIDGAPVINGIPIVVKMAEMAVKLKATTGLSTSRVSDFVKPPPEVIEEFLTNPKGL